MVETSKLDPLFVCERDCYYWNKRTRRVYRSNGDNIIRFTKTQFLLLSTLLSDPDKLFDNDLLVTKALDCFPGEDSIGTLRENIKRLKDKLEFLSPDLRQKIEAQHGGYRWASIEYNKLKLLRGRKRQN